MNKFKTAIITTLYLLVLDLIFSYFLFHSLNLLNFLFYLFNSITFSLLLNLLSLLFKDKAKKVFITIALILITLLYASQYVHFSFYDCFYSIYSLVNGGQVLGFISAIIKVIVDNIIGFLVILVLLIYTVIIINKIKDEKSKKTPLVLVIILIINLIITLGFTFYPSNDIYSRYNLLNKTNSETKNVEHFGLITAMLIDLNRYISGFHDDLINTQSKYVYRTGDENKYNVISNTFDNIDTKNKDIIKVTNYLKNEAPTNKNKYTGIFKDKNLIFITAESFSFYSIDKEMTPTLYKMKNEGFSFNNFYTPIYYASTSDGEYTNLTGLLPREGTWSNIRSKNNDYSFSYASLFKESGYKTYAYHNGIYNFYDRDKVMPNFGYKFKGCGNGLEKYINCDIFPQSDIEMFSSTVKDYKTSKFHTYYMSISSHLPHDFENNDIAKKNKNYVENTSHSDVVKAYIAGVIELDKALESLLKELEANHILDDTVIVLVPDHYPYGLSDEEYKELNNFKTGYDKHKSGLIIYNSKTKGETIDKYASNIDILPTLLNMFDIKYDSRLYIGRDIMSNSDGIVIFNDRSFLTDKGYYNENKNEFKSFKRYNKDYVKNKRTEVFNKQNVSSLILEKNYYKHIKSAS